MRRKIILTWLAVVTWAAIIWGLGGEDFANESTSRFIRPLLEWLFPNLSAGGLDLTHFVIRKGFHAFEYGLLALLALRALLLTWPLSWARAGTVAVSIALALALADEGRQATSETRGGNWTDVLLDLAGASATVGTVHLLPRQTKQLLIGTGS